MSQANPIIGANKSGLTYRQEDNDGKKALLNHHKGASAPLYAEAGMLWLDDAATPWKLKVHDGADWICLSDIHAGNNTVVPYLGTSAICTPIYAPDTGTANSYALAPDAVQAAYQAGQMFLLKPSADNTGSSTLAVNGLAPVAIKNCDGTNVAPGALKTTGVYLIVHNGTNFLVLNPTISGNMGLQQIVSGTYTGFAQMSATIPLDDTIPQRTEGTEVISISITPKSTTSRIRLRFAGFVYNSSTYGVVAALFQNSDTSAFFANANSYGSSNVTNHLDFFCDHYPNTTSPVTYSLRLGAAGGYIRPNALSNARILGGSTLLNLVAEEYA